MQQVDQFQHIAFFCGYCPLGTVVCRVCTAHCRKNFLKTRWRLFLAKLSVVLSSVPYVSVNTGEEGEKESGPFVHIKSRRAILSHNWIEILRTREQYTLLAKLLGCPFLWQIDRDCERLLTLLLNEKVTIKGNLYYIIGFKYSLYEIF